MNREESNDRRDQGARRKEVHSRFIGTGEILEKPEDVGPDKSAEIADRIDQGNTASGSFAREKLRGKRPKRRLRAVQTDGCGRHRDEPPDRAADFACGEQAGSCDETRDDEVPATLFLAI